MKIGDCLKLMSVQESLSLEDDVQRHVRADGWKVKEYLLLKFVVRERTRQASPDTPYAAKLGGAGNLGGSEREMSCERETRCTLH